MADIIQPDSDPDGKYSTKLPFKQPKAGDKLQWFWQRNPELYSVFMARLVSRKGSQIEIILLDKATGKDAHADTLVLDLVDLTQTYPHTPSTIQLATPDNLNCGFVLITQAYVTALAKDKRYTDALPKAQSIGKWPRGQGTLAMLLKELATSEKASVLTRDDRDTLEQFINSL